MWRGRRSAAVAFATSIFICPESRTGAASHQTGDLSAMDRRVHSPAERKGMGHAPRTPCPASRMPGLVRQARHRRSQSTSASRFHVRLLDRKVCSRLVATPRSPALACATTKSAIESTSREIATAFSRISMACAYLDLHDSASPGPAYAKGNPGNNSKVPRACSTALS